VLDRNQLNLRATELGELLAESEEIAVYRDAEAALLAHPRAAALIHEIRESQQAENASKYVIGGTELDSHLEALLEELESIPEAVAFMKSQATVQALMHTVSQIISQGITNRAGLRIDPTI
jgi:cell fate (sporulation/competence/biofilm development) regulator YlbF (YheA/YmcA/DUF963 family)